MRVMVVSGHPRVRHSLGQLIRGEPFVESVIEAESTEDAVARVQIEVPDIAVVDLRLPTGSGIDTCREIRSLAPAVRVILLAGHVDVALYRQAIDAGAAALMMKDTDPAALLNQIRKIAASSAA